jgi:hypothetical protein
LAVVVDAEVGSESDGFGDAAAMLGEGEGALVTGGGSIVVGVGLDANTGSGKAGISSMEAVSMVICLGGAAGACLNV